MKKKLSNPTTLAFPVIARPHLPAKRSAMNAVKHGLNAKALVLKHAGETTAGFNRHIREIVGDLQPEGHLQLQIAEKIGINLWNQKRADRFRAASTRDQFKNLLFNQPLIPNSG